MKSHAVLRTKVPVLLSVVALAIGACGGSAAAPSADVTSSLPASSTTRPSPVVTTDPPERRAVSADATIPIDGTPLVLSADEQSVWIGRLDGISRIDPTSNQVVLDIAVPSGVFNYAVGFGSLWIPEYEADVVRRYNTTTGELEAEIEGLLRPEDVAVTEDGVWVANHHGGNVSRIDPASNEIIESVKVTRFGQSGPKNLIVVDNVVWVSAPNLPGLVGIDATTNEVVGEIPVVPPAFPCGEPGVIGDEIWLSSCADGTIVTAADPVTLTADRLFDAVGEAGAPFELGGLAWMAVVPADRTPAYLAGVDPESLEIVDAIDLPSPGLSTTVAFGSLWVATEEPGTVTRIDLEQIAGGG